MSDDNAGHDPVGDPTDDSADVSSNGDDTGPTSGHDTGPTAGFELGPRGEEFRSGFVAIIGRPNVGKSTLLNKILDEKVTIVSDTAQTTRHQIRGVLTDDDCQLVFVDTPGISKPRSALGSHLNEVASRAIDDVDLICLVIDGRSGFGRGDRRLAQSLDPARTVVVVNKIDGLAPERVLEQLAAAAELDFSAYFPVSAFTGKGVPALVDHLRSRMPKGPLWYPADTVTDVPQAFVVAELVREQLLRSTRDEVPHSVATRVVEWEWPRIRVEILVERESQKGIVIGKGGETLKQVGIRVRRQLPPGVYLELIVNVEKNWQQSPELIERLGY
ncbi:MAG: GTPase Era [Acidimicrobiia bacterium]|nr:GTPase Era [Acidimicrobiia bacterium]